MERLRLSASELRDDLAQERRREVGELFRQGKRQVEIAAALGITQARVSQIMRNIPRVRSGRRRAMAHVTYAGAAT